MSELLKYGLLNIKYKLPRQRKVLKWFQSCEVRHKCVIIGRYFIFFSTAGAIEVMIMTVCGGYDSLWGC